MDANTQPIVKAVC